MRGALVREGHADYRLPQAESVVWVDVDNVALQIRRTELGVTVTAHVQGSESMNFTDLPFMRVDFEAIKKLEKKS